MTASTIPLAKGYNPGKLEYPVALSIKYDGVPVRIDVAKHNGSIVSSARTRSGEACISVEPLVARFINATMACGSSFDAPVTFVAEITHKEYTDFKDISGVVRKQSHQEGLVLNFFDVEFAAQPGLGFGRRTLMLDNIIYAASAWCEDIHYVEQDWFGSQQELEAALACIPAVAEGGIIRSVGAAFKPDTRHWDYQKYVIDPTVDLRIVGFEEAVSKDGEPKGMVGRINAEYKGTVIGIGPGKMSHAERTRIWADYAEGFRFPRGAAIRSRIATIQYKRDDSYTALRQPTFQHWRPEKTEPSYE